MPKLVLGPYMTNTYKTNPSNPGNRKENSDNTPGEDLSRRGMWPEHSLS